MYCDGENPDLCCALDWDFQYRGQWARSIRETYNRWRVIHGIDLVAYYALLETFGLLEWKHEYPAWRIFHKSPAWLIAERRRKEREIGIGIPLMVTNDSVGPWKGVSAEEFH